MNGQLDIALSSFLCFCQGRSQSRRGLLNLPFPMRRRYQKAEARRTLRFRPVKHRLNTLSQQQPVRPLGVCIDSRLDRKQPTGQPDAARPRQPPEEPDRLAELPTKRIASRRVDS